MLLYAFHRADRAPEQNAQRHVRGLGNRVPSSHIQPGHGNHRQTLIADKVQAFPRRVVKIQWRNAVTLQHVAEIVKGRHQVLHRLRRVRLEIGAPDDALLGL